jgi:hypothetical protein
MQFSKRVSELSRLYGIEPKDVLFAMLATCPGVSTVEAFAVIYKPTSTTNNAISTRASQYIGQRPGLRKLIDELNAQQFDNPEQPTPRRGRPRKDPPTDSPTEQDTPRLDYTDKDAVLQELARIAERSEKESDKLAAIREISALQRMKQEAAVEDEKRVTFWIPLNYERAEELRQYLARYYAEKDGNTES